MTSSRTRIAFAGLALAGLALVLFLAFYRGGLATDALPAAQAVTDRSSVPLVESGLGPARSTPVAPQVPADVLARDRAFISNAFPALSSWSLEEVKPLLSTTALNATSDAELAEVMTTLSARLGALQRFDEPKPAHAPTALQSPDAATGLQPYAFTAYYETGIARVELVVETQAQRSALYSFDIHIPN